MKMRIWHNSDFGNDPFTQEVPDLETAKLLLNTLAAYDLYQGDRVVANAQGCEIFVNDEWEEWEREEDGESITKVIDEEKEALRSRGSAVVAAVSKTAHVGSNPTGSATNCQHPYVRGKTCMICKADASVSKKSSRKTSSRRG